MTERRTGRGIHAFLSHLAYGVDTVPGFSGITLIGAYRDGPVQLLHSFLSIPVVLYSTDRRLFACLGDLPDRGLPPVVEIPMETFAVRRSVRAIPWADHVSHLEGVTPPVWQSMSCDLAGKLQEEGRGLSCQWMTYVSPDGASRLMDHPGINITAASQTLFPLMAGRAPP